MRASWERSLSTTSRSRPRRRPCSAYRAIALWVPAILGTAAFVALRRTLRDEAAEIAVCAPQTEIEVIGLGRVMVDASSGAPR